MRYARFLAVLVLLPLILPALGTALQEQQEDVAVVTRIEGPLVESMMATLDRVIGRAEQEDAAVIIIEIVSIFSGGRLH